VKEGRELFQSVLGCTGPAPAEQGSDEAEADG